MTDDEHKICFECIGETHLSGDIERDGLLEVCSYCCEQAPTIALEDLADRVEAVFGEHYERTPTEPNFYESLMIRDRELGYDWYREGTSVADLIPDIIGCSSDVAQDLHAVLRERHEDWNAALAGEETAFDDERCTTRRFFQTTKHGGRNGRGSFTACSGTPAILIRMHQLTLQEFLTVLRSEWLAAEGP